MTFTRTLVQIGIRKEEHQVVEIGRVSKDLREGEVGFEPLFRYVDDSPVDAPGWERADQGDRNIHRYS